MATKSNSRPHCILPYGAACDTSTNSDRLITQKLWNLQPFGSRLSYLQFPSVGRPYSLPPLAKKRRPKISTKPLATSKLQSQQESQNNRTTNNPGCKVRLISKFHLSREHSMPYIPFQGKIHWNIRKFTEISWKQQAIQDYTYTFYYSWLNPKKVQRSTSQLQPKPRNPCWQKTTHHLA